MEGNDAPGTGRVVLTGMGDYRGTVEKTFMVKSNEVEPDPSEGKIDMSSAKFVGLAASYVYMGQPVIPVVNLMLGNTLLVQSVDYVMSIVDNDSGYGDHHRCRHRPLRRQSDGDVRNRAPDL